MKQLLAICLSLSLLGCAALRPQSPSVPLRWTLDQNTTTPLPWETVRRLDASPALHSDRLLVNRGSELLQHARFRWYARPAQMLEERMRWQTGDHPSRFALDGASLDLWLHGFELQVDAGEQATVRMAVSAVLNCAEEAATRRDKTVSLGVSEHRVALSGQTSEQITAGFTAAADAVLTELAARAGNELPNCAADRDADHASASP